MRTLTRISTSLVFLAGMVFPQTAMFFGSNTPGTSTAIDLVSKTSAFSATGGNLTTGALNTTGANFLVVACSHYALGGSATITDSLSNSWASFPVSEQPNMGSTNLLGIFYAVNATVGAAQTFTCSATSPFPSMAVAAFKNVATSSVTDVSHSLGGTTETTSIQPGSITPTGNGYLVIAGLSWGIGACCASTVSINSGMIVTNTEAPGANDIGVSLAYIVQGSAALINPTWTFGSAQTAGAMVTSIASFKK